MATHSSILALEIPWTEEPGGLYSPWGRKRVRHTRATKPPPHNLCQSAFGFSLCFGVTKIWKLFGSGVTVNA